MGFSLYFLIYRIGREFESTIRYELRDISRIEVQISAHRLGNAAQRPNGFRPVFYKLERIEEAD